MRNSGFAVSAVMAIAVATLTTIACKESGTEPQPGAGEITDAQLSTMTRASSEWSYYKNNSAIIPKSPQSGHSGDGIVVRYNLVAAERLDASGKVTAGAEFADSALIVKELYFGSTLVRYVVMYKARNHSLQGDGWLWAYYNPDGSTFISISKKGSDCTGCHQPGIDYTLMNATHP